jgi:hypothetical protein
VKPKLSGAASGLPSGSGCSVVEDKNALGVPVALPQHPDEHRPERPVLLAVDQQLEDGASPASCELESSAY